MRFHGRLAAFAALSALTFNHAATADADLDATSDVYQDVFNAVDQSHLQSLLKDMTGQNPVTVGGQTFTIADRYLPASKANYRAYWSSYFQGLSPSITVTQMPYTTQYKIEKQGHDVEAILPGKSPDSIVIIVHYDSIGPHGADNNAVDDDMTGMAEAMETARILVGYAAQGRLEHTVRFVAADYEEWGDLEGARFYAKYIQALAKSQNFKLAGAIDFEQAGWHEGANSFDVFDCGGSATATSKTLGKQLITTAKTYSKIATTEGCMGDNSDHYAMWEIGVPAVVFSEHDPFNNPHFDQEGGDTYDRIDQAYYFSIAQVGVTFATQLVGIDPPASNLELGSL